MYNVISVPDMYPIVVVSTTVAVALKSCIHVTVLLFISVFIEMLSWEM